MNPARVIQLPTREADAPARSEPVSREAYAGVLWARGDVDAAVEIWNEILHRDPQRTEVRLALARARQVLGQWDEAARELSLCLPVHPDRPDLLARLAVCYLRTASYPHALVLLDQALRIDPRHCLAAAAQAVLRARTDTAHPDSGGVLEWPEASHPPPPSCEAVDQLFQEACRAMQSEDPELARARLEEVLLLDPQHDAALLEMAQMEEAEHRPVWASRYYESALRARPQSWEAAFNLARLAAENGEDARARALAERALLLNPQCGGAAWLLAQLCERAGDTDEARFWLERTVQLEPKNVGALTRLGRLYLLAGKLEDAAAWMELAYDAGPDRYDTAYNLGLVRWRNGETRQARDLWLRARQLEPARVEAAQALAGLELAAGNLEQAEHHAACHPSAGLSFLLAQERALQGDVDRAIGHYRKALDFNPHWRDAWVNLGVLLRQAGQEQAAREAWQQALRIDPSLAGEYFG